MEAQDQAEHHCIGGSQHCCKNQFQSCPAHDDSPPSSASGAEITAHTALASEDLKPQSKLITTALYDNDHNMTVLTVSNTDYETVNDTLLLPDATYESIGNDGKCTFISDNGAVKAEFTLDAMESVAIIKR